MPLHPHRWSDRELDNGTKPARRAGAAPEKKADQWPGDRQRAQPRTPAPAQRLVGIDPGRRDMVALVSNEGDSFTVSTKSFVHASGTTAAARHTTRLLRNTPLGDGTTLLMRLEALPSRRDVNQWDEYLAALLPLLDAIVVAYRTKSLRRWKFRMFQKRDRALDALCSRITTRKDNVLVAFGDASSSSLGLGSAAAPRLPKRLATHHPAFPWWRHGTQARSAVDATDSCKRLP